LGFRTRDLDKTAQDHGSFSVLGMGGNTMKLIGGLSLITGIPIGIAAHVIGRNVSQERTKERELQEQIKYYKNTTEGLKQTLQE
jgi:hypothetical protein